MCSRPAPRRHWGSRIDTDKQVIRANSMRMQKRCDDVLLTLRVDQGRRYVCGLDAKRRKETQPFCYRIFRHWMVMCDQERVQERAWKACKGQAVFGATEVGQDSTARIADQIDDQIEAL